MSALVVRLDDRTATARHEVGHLICAVSQGWGVQTITADRPGGVAGVTSTIPPQGRSQFQLAIERIVILLGGRAACLVGDDDHDIDEAVELAREIVLSEEEGQALLDFCLARATALLERASTRGTLDEFVQLLEDRGELHLDHPAKARDFAPLIEIRTAPINITLPPQPPPIVNVTLPEQQPPVVNVQAPDKIISFARNGDGEIVEAETTTAPVAA